MVFRTWAISFIQNSKFKALVIINPFPYGETNGFVPHYYYLSIICHCPTYPRTNGCGEIFRALFQVRWIQNTIDTLTNANSNTSVTIQCPYATQQSLRISAIITDIQIFTKWRRLSPREKAGVPPKLINVTKSSWSYDLWHWTTVQGKNYLNIIFFTYKIEFWQEHTS